MLRWTVLIVALCSAGCGLGTAAIVAGTEGGGGQGNAPPGVSDLRVTNATDDGRARVSPAYVRFSIADPESNPVAVEFFREVNGAPVALTLVDATPPLVFASSPAGEPDFVKWDFETDLQSTAFAEDIKIVARPVGAPDAEADDVSVGNDAPEIIAAPGPDADEVDGIVALPFTVADSSGDLVSIKIEYDIVGDDPDESWRVARPGGLTETPDFAFEGQQALPNEPPATIGTDLIFFWNTDVDLPEGDESVLVRFTPNDGVDTGSSRETPEAFQVDNNEEPDVVLRELSFGLNLDEHGGIPVTYEVFDEENDPVEVVFQWRRPGEGFPALPTNPTALETLLADPVERRGHRIAEELPTYVEGPILSASAGGVRLSGLASRPAPLVAERLAGCELEILRGSATPEPLVWTSKPLVRPVAALPIGDGRVALVLDRSGSGGWRVREIELGTGEVVADVAMGIGVPTAMALDPTEQHLFVASLQGAWQVERFVLPVRARPAAGRALGFQEGGDGVRGLAALGSGVALASVDDSLVRLDFTVSPPVSTQLLFGLAKPWGIAVDPLEPNRAYVALRGEDRVVQVDLGTGIVRGIAAEILRNTEPTFPSPRALALERGGARVLVVAEAPGRAAVLRGLNLRSLHGLDGGEPGLFDLAEGLDARSSIATGANGLRLLALPDTGGLAAGGGLEQRRRIAAYEPLAQEAEVDLPFDPVPGPFRRWRIPLSTCHSPGVRTFVWDTRSVGAGDFFLRALPFDSELGRPDDASGSKPVAPLWEESSLLETPDFLRSLEAEDIDGDGDVDLVSTGPARLTVHFRIGPQSFEDAVLAIDPVAVGEPTAAAVADLDGDEDLDLVVASGASNISGPSGLTVFYQEGPRLFSAPLVLGGPGTTDGAQDVLPGDLNDDGRLDLVAVGRPSSGVLRLTVFQQDADGSFVPRSDPIEATSPLPDALASDLDGDGDVDLAATTAEGIAVFFQSSGVLDPVPLLLPLDSFLSANLAAADLDMDGDLDLAATQEFFEGLGFSNVTLYFQVSPGVFDPVPRVLLDSTDSGYAQSVVPADVDGDGDIDLVVGFQRRTTVFLQVGSGRFEPTPQSDLAQRIPAGVADMDGDGRLDLLAPSNERKVLLQSRPGFFDPLATVLTDMDPENEPSAVASADLDVDGDLDLVSANHGFVDDLTIYLQSSPGTFHAVATLGGEPGAPANLSAVVAADLDGDGDGDVASTNFRSRTVTAYLQDGPGAFGPEPLVLGDLDQPTGVGVIAAEDLDRDGDLDLVSSDGVQLTLYFQTGAGVFGPVPRLLNVNSPTALASGDVDADGDADLAVSSENLFTILRQTSPGRFGLNQRIHLGDGILFSNAVDLVDVDVDGAMDLVGSTNAGFPTPKGSLLVYFQSDELDFGAPPVELSDLSFPDVLDRTQDVTTADLDGNGLPDLVAASSEPLGPPTNGNTVTVFFQSAPRIFDPLPLVLGGSRITPGVRSLVAADVDGDGDPDLACNNGIFWNRD